MSFHGMVLDGEEAKNVAVVHKTNQGYSGKDLWKLKAERPDLFDGSAAHKADATPGVWRPPAGYVRVTNMPGWFFNQQLCVYLNKEEPKKLFCRNDETGELYQLHRGEDVDSLSVRGDASAIAGKTGGASKHVVINDLHRAAQSMKCDLSHLDSPAAMFAVYDGRSAVGGAPMAQAAAQGFHVKLLPRLAGYRGQWDEARIQAVISESLVALAAEIGAGDSGISAAVALLLGRRLFLVASRGAICCVLDPEETDIDCRDNDVTGVEGQPPATHCIDLARHETHLGVLLTSGAVIEKIGFTRLSTITRSHLISDRIKAACVSVVGEAQSGGVQPPLVTTAVRIAWAGQDEEGPAAKRARTDGPQKVRVRHILLRHANSQLAPGERVKKKATRSQAEAEAQMLKCFMELQMRLGDPAAFTTQCKAVSECETSLRGGDLAGDLGWLDKDPSKNKKTPATLVKAAFALAPGQVSDIVATERGIHLLYRTA
eukprot:TRINITY_DN81354_c0_g1_i1.p1 TRINITY_DN81354_c0_g1~~TRINITY_DN81354_c0_g1_i1.p1  ORF type:complete len:486 (+),score=133.11 TRINITY_DN81354_c0_g1_i1:176-1633(+)